MGPQSGEGSVESPSSSHGKAYDDEGRHDEGRHDEGSVNDVIDAVEMSQTEDKGCGLAQRGRVLCYPNPATGVPQDRRWRITGVDANESRC